MSSPTAPRSPLDETSIPLCVHPGGNQQILDAARASEAQGFVVCRRSTHVGPPNQPQHLTVQLGPFEALRQASEDELVLGQRLRRVKGKMRLDEPTVACQILAEGKSDVARRAATLVGELDLVLMTGAGIGQRRRSSRTGSVAARCRKRPRARPGRIR